VNVQVDGDVPVLVLSAALASQGLALVWRGGCPTISKAQTGKGPVCQCGKPANVAEKGRVFCASCYLGTQHS